MQIIVNDYTFMSAEGTYRRAGLDVRGCLNEINGLAVAIEPVPLDMILHPEDELGRKLSPRKAPAKEIGMTPVKGQVNIA
jgi:hypothetical protein